MASKATKYCLVLFQGRSHTAQLRTISRSLVSHVQDLLDEKINTPPDKTDIEVWLDSPGGDAHSAYKLILDLRHRCRCLTAVVPDLAKSAATLFVMGVDEIHMAASSELGPLDVQIAHPDREDQVVSGLDVSGSLDYLSKYALNLILGGGATVMEATELPRLEVLKSMQNFTANFLHPCLAKLDPHITRRAVYQLKVAERYAMTLLSSRNVRSSQRPTKESVSQMVAQLVNDYPVHEFVISRAEARRMGLPIADAEKHPYWPMIKSLHSAFAKDEKSAIFVVSEKELIASKKEAEKSQQKPSAKLKNKKSSGAQNENGKKASSGASKPGKNGSEPASVASRISQ